MVLACIEIDIALFRSFCGGFTLLKTSPDVESNQPGAEEEEVQACLLKYART